MAKRRPTRATRKSTVKLSPRDKKTMARLTGLADRVVSAAKKKRDPYVDIPSRTLSNVRYSPRKRILEMGNNKNRRQLFDLSQDPSEKRNIAADLPDVIAQMAAIMKQEHAIND